MSIPGEGIQDNASVQVPSRGLDVASEAPLFGVESAFNEAFDDEFYQRQIDFRSNFDPDWYNNGAFGGDAATFEPFSSLGDANQQFEENESLQVQASGISGSSNLSSPSSSWDPLFGPMSTDQMPSLDDLCAGRYLRSNLNEPQIPQRLTISPAECQLTTSSKSLLDFHNEGAKERPPSHEPQQSEPDVSSDGSSSPGLKAQPSRKRLKSKSEVPPAVVRIWPPIEQGKILRCPHPDCRNERGWTTLNGYKYHLKFRCFQNPESVRSLKLAAGVMPKNKKWDARGFEATCEQCGKVYKSEQGFKLHKTKNNGREEGKCAKRGRKKEAEEQKANAPLLAQQEIQLQPLGGHDQQMNLSQGIVPQRREPESVLDFHYDQL